MQVAWGYCYRLAPEVRAVICALCLYLWVCANSWWLLPEMNHNIEVGVRRGSYRRTLHKLIMILEFDNKVSVRNVHICVHKTNYAHTSKYG